MQNKQFQTITARFQPCQEHIATLRPELVPVIGTVSEFMYAWRMDDTEQFPGVWALTTEDRRFGGYWIPEFYLEEIC